MLVEPVIRGLVFNFRQHRKHWPPCQLVILHMPRTHFLCLFHGKLITSYWLLGVRAKKVKEPLKMTPSYLYKDHSGGVIWTSETYLCGCKWKLTGSKLGTVWRFFGFWKPKSDSVKSKVCYLWSCTRGFCWSILICKVAIRLYSNRFVLFWIYMLLHFLLTAQTNLIIAQCVKMKVKRRFPEDYLETRWILRAI